MHTRHPWCRTQSLSAILALIAALFAVAAPVPAAADHAPGHVVQDGPNNFAGPASDCPGAGWNCTTATNVTQSSSGGQNVFQCSGASCSASQTNTTGDNSASCTQSTSSSSATGQTTQTCSIDQTNTSGANSATVDQTAAVNVNILSAAVLVVVDRVSTQEFSVVQANGGGTNTLNGLQNVNHAVGTTVNVPVTHLQDGRQTGSWTQTSVSGDQDADVRQAQNISSTVNTPFGIVQRQNTRKANDQVHQQAFPLAQTETGRNTLALEQEQNLTQSAGNLVGAHNGSVTQLQGPTGGTGALLRGDLDSEVFSEATTDQSKTWTQQANVGASGQLHQDQQDQLVADWLPNVGKTPHEIEGHQKATLSNGGTRLCEQLYRWRTKDNGAGSQECVLPSGTFGQTFSGKEGEAYLRCTGSGAEDECTDADQRITGLEGCSAGTWKNNEYQWPTTADQVHPLGHGPVSPDDRLADVFGELDNHPVYAGLADDELRDALDYSGGNTTVGAASILLRQAVAAWVNANHADVSYPMAAADGPGVIDSVQGSTNDALASLDRSTMLDLANTFDGFNSLGCNVG